MAFGAVGVQGSFEFRVRGWFREPAGVDGLEGFRVPEVSMSGAHRGLGYRVLEVIRRA